MTRALPVLTVVLAILALWYLGAVALNAPWARDQAARAGGTLTTAELIADTMDQRRPVLPPPHQVAAEIWKTTAQTRLGSPRNLLGHAWTTLSATLLGFVAGAALGMALAALIVHDRGSAMSLTPWIVASQTVPILAIAPMIIVVLNAVGITGLMPKALISAYLSFFPVAIAMIAGLRSPQRTDMDLMRTYAATRGQVFWRLRLPASLPYLFPALKVAAAISLVGAIVAELPTGAVAGLGARLLAGSYYGQTVQIWSALIMDATLAAILVWLVGLAQRLTLRRMGLAA